MFKNLFGREKSEIVSVQEEQQQSPYGGFSIEAWRDTDAVNGQGFSGNARAQGRYEIAEALHIMGVDWYEANVVSRPHPGDSPEMRERFQDSLRQWREYTPEFARLVATRERLLSALAEYPQGVDRDELKKQVGHDGMTKWGVICNQLARGGFIVQEQQGKKYVLKPSAELPMTNSEFLKAEIPRSWHKWSDDGDAMKKVLLALLPLSPAHAAKPKPGPIPAGGFKNCAAAFAASYGDIRRGERGYYARLDRDRDGVACEWEKRR